MWQCCWKASKPDGSLSLENMRYSLSWLSLQLQKLFHGPMSIVSSFKGNHDFLTYEHWTPKSTGLSGSSCFISASGYRWFKRETLCFSWLSLHKKWLSLHFSKILLKNQIFIIIFYEIDLLSNTACILKLKLSEFKCSLYFAWICRGMLEFMPHRNCKVGCNV